MARTLRDVVFIDGVRTPSGKAGRDGLHAENPSHADYGKDDQR